MVFECVCSSEKHIQKITQKTLIKILKEAGMNEAKPEKEQNRANCYSDAVIFTFYLVWLGKHVVHITRNT